MARVIKAVGHSASRAHGSRCHHKAVEQEAWHDQRGGPMSRRPSAVPPDGGRLFQRYLAVGDGTLACPRRGTINPITCDGCRFLCRREADRATVICTFPFPARETLTWRSRRNQGLRIALGHSLERT